ncbi:MAG: NUDIX domain-containing protein [Raineya sp.]|nr:NUDIX domain-containing protein [Raineya sp.]
MLHCFIHQYRLQVTEKELNYTYYQNILDCSQIPFSNALLKGLSGKVLVFNADTEIFYQTILFLDKQENIAIREITFVVENKKEFKKNLHKYFEVVKASGGLVVYQDKILMIFRRGKWDLPKGKIDEGEKAQTAAIREVAEECNLQTQIQEKLCTTWHHYWMGGKMVIKKTKWYLMTTSNPMEAHPQAEEDIEEIRWVSLTEAQNLLANSFPSIEFVISQYFAKQSANRS